MVSSPRRRKRPNEDEGSVLLLVMIFTIVVSLVIIPLLSYQQTVLRSNSVLSAKTARLEAVKAGTRIALADPAALYRTCGNAGPTVAVTLAGTTTSGKSVTTRCYFLDYQTAQDSNELRYGLVATQVGSAIPSALTGARYSPANPESASEWRTATTQFSETNRIWLPNLPIHSLDRRSPGGFQMPAGFTTCTVYFPGTYTDAVTLTGPTYFASGIYYFENTLTVQNGASVVVGLGATEGCSTDQDAAFYAVDAPVTHNISGLGGTLIFGKNGRLLVTNTASLGPSLVLNSRYVSAAEADTDTSAGLSIASVNGTPSQSAQDLTWSGSGALSIPYSLVGNVDPVSATSADYTPSNFHAKPSVPSKPTGVVATAYNGAAVVSWSAPSSGGSSITGYRVTSSSGATCTTSGSTACAVTGLANGSAVTFSVVASNVVGDSSASSASSAITPAVSSTALAVPTAPATPTAVAYSGAARVSWTAAATTTAPVTSYRVTSSPEGLACTLSASTSPPPTLQCDFVGLTNGTAYTFTVVATNAAGDSVASAASTAVTPTAGASTIPSTPPVVGALYQPTAVVEIDLANSSSSSILIPGYVSIPQGRLRVNNPFGLDVRMTGGVLAAQFDVTDARATGLQTVPIGFVEAVVQRVFRIESRSSGRESSIAIVQVNQNGAYAVNTWEVQ